MPDYSGSGLAGVAQGADGGNPMSNAFSGAVRLSDGIVNYATTDFSVPGTGFARTVSRVWTDQPGLVVNPSFGNGEIMTQLPYLIQATGLDHRRHRRAAVLLRPDLRRTPTRRGFSGWSN